MHFPMLSRKGASEFPHEYTPSTTKRHPHDGITCADFNYGTENAIRQAVCMP